MQELAHTLHKARNLENIKKDAYPGDDDGWCEWQCPPANVSSPNGTDVTDSPTHHPLVETAPVLNQVNLYVVEL